MEREQILGLYDWDMGVCFQHPGEKTDTTVVKTLQPRSAPAEVIRACRDCVTAMERTRQAAAEGAGIPYVPGHAGDSL